MQYELFDRVIKLLPDQDVKECRMCNRSLPIVAFNIDRSSTKGKPFYRTACRECERNKSRETEYIKTHTANISKSNTCECCNKAIPESDRVNFDHCPDSLTFRGWLCTNCNTGIGKLGDSIEGLEKALSYLNIHRDTQ